MIEDLTEVEVEFLAILVQSVKRDILFNEVDVPSVHQLQALVEQAQCMIDRAKAGQAEPLHPDDAEGVALTLERCDSILNKLGWSERQL